MVQSKWQVCSKRSSPRPALSSQPPRTYRHFPEPKNEDLSSGDDDFAVVFPSPRPRRSRRSPSDPLHYSLPNDRLTQKQAGFPSISAETHSYEYPYSGLPHENSDFNLPNFVLQDEEIGRRRGKQLFDVDTQIDQYFPSSSLSMDMSAKASGKQRSNEVSNESSIPISDLRLGIESQPSMELRRSRNPPYLEDEDEDEYVDPRSRKSAGQSSGIRAGRSRDAATRSGKRHVTPEEEDDESALDQSADALSPLAGSPVKTSGKKRKVNRYPCPVPSCKETFTRRNDVRRHIRNAAVHRDSPEALALIGEVVGAGTRCKYCNADLSRSDARMRHERASACGKRTTQKMKDQMLLMKA
ncbi:hypothetical protein GYMLUDRAFT_634844 [Collybiopsis luxurians FD-317 M1]|nr:hypothetical protein GYMLUDRAFT_634844 [Collybiopsis luxurians FD-317 M1]